MNDQRPEAIQFQIQLMEGNLQGFRDMLKAEISALEGFKLAIRTAEDNLKKMNAASVVLLSEYRKCKQMHSEYRESAAQVRESIANLNQAIKNTTEEIADARSALKQMLPPPAETRKGVLLEFPDAKFRRDQETD